MPVDWRNPRCRNGTPPRFGGRVGYDKRTRTHARDPREGANRPGAWPDFQGVERERSYPQTPALGSPLMPWFKVDDQLHSHPKPRRASLAALGLWTLSGSYSMAYKLDGFVPAWYIHGHNQGKRHAESLVRVGLWEKAVRKDEEGYLFHDWDDYQPSADEIEAEREAARERQRAFRKKRREARANGADNA